MDVRPGIGSCNRVSESTHSYLYASLHPWQAWQVGGAGYRAAGRADGARVHERPGGGCVRRNLSQRTDQPEQGRRMPRGPDRTQRFLRKQRWQTHRRLTRSSGTRRRVRGSEHWLEFWNIANSPIEFPPTAKGKTSSNAFVYVPLFLILESPIKGEVKGPHGFIAPFTFRTITECMAREGKEGKQGPDGSDRCRRRDWCRGSTGPAGAEGKADRRARPAPPVRPARRALAQGEHGAAGSTGATGATGHRRRDWCPGRTRCRRCDRGHRPGGREQVPPARPGERRPARRTRRSRSDWCDRRKGRTRRNRRDRRKRRTGPPGCDRGDGSDRRDRCHGEGATGATGEEANAAKRATGATGEAGERGETGATGETGERAKRARPAKKANGRSGRDRRKRRTGPAGCDGGDGPDWSDGP